MYVCMYVCVCVFVQPRRVLGKLVNVKTCTA